MSYQGHLGSHRGRVGPNYWAHLRSILGQFGHQVQFGPGQADNPDHTYYEIRQKTPNTRGYAYT